MDRAPAPALRKLTAASLALVLVVVLASAAIRLFNQELGTLLPVVRGVHRVSASAAALLILGVGWLAWRGGRRPLAAAVVLLMIGLSVLGAATGTTPPPAAQAGNLLGGLALAAMLAWLLNTKEGISWNGLMWIGLVCIQALLGAWLAIFAEELWSLPLIAHATLGFALAGGIIWLSSFRRILFAVLAIAVPVTGIAAALLGQPLAAGLAHAAAVALLIAAAAWAHGRFA
jgi:heme A synthase